MARHKFQSTVRETLSTMLNDPDIQNSLGVAKFSKKARGVFCKIYLRKGRIYSVFSTDISPDYITRLYQSGDLSLANLEIVKKSFNSDLRNHGISEFLIDRHMVTSDVMENVKQDFFLDLFEKIIEWDEVNADWIANETTDVLKITSVSYDRILELLENRKNFLIEISEKLNVPVSELETITFTKIKESGFDNDTPVIYHQLFSLADGQWDVTSSAVNFGLTNFKTFQALFDLWKHNFVSINFNGVTLPNNVMNIDEQNDAVKAEPVAPKVEPVQEAHQDEPQGFVTSGYVNLDAKDLAKSIYVNNDNNVEIDDVDVDVELVHTVEPIKPEFENYSEPEFLEISEPEPEPEQIIVEKKYTLVDVLREENADNKIDEKNIHPIINRDLREAENVDFILPKIDDEESTLVGRINSSKVAPSVSPVILKSTKSIARNESNKVKLDVLKEQKNLLLHVLQNNLEYKEEHEEHTELNAQPTVVEPSEVTETLVETEETVTPEVTPESVEETLTEPIRETETPVEPVINDTPIYPTVETVEEETAETTYPSPKENPVENTNPESHDSEFSDMIDKITSQLRERKDYIADLERSVTFDETEVKTLQEGIEKKKEKIAAQKREYTASIEKLKFF